MSSAALDMILNTPACRGAFRLRGDRIEALKQGAVGVETAERTRALWASLNAVVPDAGVVIGKRDDAVSVASERGGMILEGSALPNLGILRSALKDEAETRPDAGEARLRPAVKSVLSLAEWIEGTEVARHYEVQAGDVAHSIWAAKGVFGLDRQSPRDLAEALAAAAEAGHEVHLTLLPWCACPQEMTHLPTDLLGAVRGDAQDDSHGDSQGDAKDDAKDRDWVFGPGGAPKTLPQGATLEDIRRAAAFAGSLITWGEGKTFEVSVVRADATRNVIAHSTGPDHIELRL